MTVSVDLLKIGSCSWKYDSWKGIVYTEDVGLNYLSEYAMHFNTVEIDQWFWSLFGENVVLPKPKVVEDYVSSVPDDFKFTIKVPNSITLTHQYNKKPKSELVPNKHFLSNKLFDDFLRLLEPMKQHIGAFIFQFEYLNKQKMQHQYQFQDKLNNFISNCPAEFNYGVEPRNNNYLNDHYFCFINGLGSIHVLLQGYRMPSVFDVYNRFREYINGLSVIRLHGPDRKAIEKNQK